MKPIQERQTLPWQSSGPLVGKVALVVGGSGGIGLAIARELNRLGCHVAIAGRSAERIETALAGLPAVVGYADCDIRITADVDRLFAKLLDRFSVVDVVVNSAGIGRAATARMVPDTTANLDEAEWDEVIDTNLRGGFLVARRAAQAMIPRRQGQIVSISSARGARRGQAFAAAYCAAKMALLAMFQSLGEELRPFGIRAWSLLPDAVDTELIAGTNLAKRGSLVSARLAAVVGELLMLPADAQWSDPLVAPLGAPLEAFAGADA